ncbi:hypothetical protein [Paenibacillus graminis]|nr:hypothetical protein [Paenibacillus graminis]MEC0169743.1 hypothetical protein [Paenibacillus graminis]
MTPESAANALKEMAQLFSCSYETAWKRYMHPAITEKFTYEEVSKHI